MRWKKRNLRAFSSIFLHLLKKFVILPVYLIDSYFFFIFTKEKQAENIVEKLCQRFRLTEEPRQWRDIAFCLSLLPFKSERSVKKLIEGLQFYRDKLHEAKVFERFTEILQKVCMMNFFVVAVVVE